jgi:uncharacterized protein
MADTVAIIHRALALVVPQFRLPLHHGWHGIDHWARVWVNARHLCRELRVDPTVPCWFAFLHDSQRCSEGSDFNHGQAAARFARHHHALGAIALDAAQLAHLESACTHHSDGRIAGPLIEQICWDADRLDLARVGVSPDPRRLCTIIAKDPDLIADASGRAQFAHARRGGPETPDELVAQLARE